MGFWRTILGLALRPLVGLPVIGLALIAAAAAFSVVPTVYQSNAAMVLTTPASGGSLPTDPKAPGNPLTNPLLQFNDSLRTTAGILILSMNTPEVLAELGIVPDGPTKITINDGHSNPDLLAVSNSGPFIYIQVDSRDPDKAISTVTRAEQIVRDTLAMRQRNLKAPKSTYISISDVTPPTKPEAKKNTKWAATGGALVGVLVVGFGLAFALDQLKAKRRRAESGQLALPSAYLAYWEEPDEPEESSDTKPIEIFVPKRKPQDSGLGKRVAHDGHTSEDTVAMPIVVLHEEFEAEDEHVDPLPKPNSGRTHAAENGHAKPDRENGHAPVDTGQVEPRQEEDPADEASHAG